MSHLRRSAVALFAAALLTSPALAQDEPFAPVQPAPSLAPDALAQARAAAARGDPAEALSRYLRVLASQPDDTAALAGAGQAALGVGDVNAAAGFLARAEARDPRNGEVKAGLAVTFLQRGDARGALRYFREAVNLGVPVASIAADRGLAYDLRGDTRRAQADYQLALAARPDDETVRRLALSQAIAGDRDAALATLDPLLRRENVPAWRARAFIFALTGDPADALTGAALVMPRDQVDALAPYLPRLAGLKAGDKAAAIHLGRFPGEAAPPTRTASTNGSVAPPPHVASIAPPVPQATRVTSAAPAVAPPGSVAVTPAPPSTVVASASAVPANNPFAPATPVPTGSVAEDAQARERALADVLADARARAAARTHVPAAIRARADRLAPPEAETAQADAPASPSPAELHRQRQEEERARKAEAAAKKKAADDAKAKAEEAKAEAEERKAKQREPARHWVQVAGGANKATLGKAWDDLKEKWPKQLAGRSPWTTHYRYTNRLLIGPFATSDAAQDWVSDRKKEGFATFRVETNAGDPVERVKD